MLLLQLGGCLCARDPVHPGSKGLVFKNQLNLKNVSEEFTNKTSSLNCINPAVPSFCFADRPGVSRSMRRQSAMFSGLSGLIFSGKCSEDIFVSEMNWIVWRVVTSHLQYWLANTTHTQYNLYATQANGNNNGEYKCFRFAKKRVRLKSSVVGCSLFIVL